MSFVREILVRGTRGGMAIALVSSLVSVTLPAAPSDAAFPQTLENLQTALNGERNAHLRYLAFAEKADQEGDRAAASLFRGAAAAEQVHGNNHEQVIRQLGGTPNLRLDTPVVKSTRENLEAAVNGDSYEHQTRVYRPSSEARLCASDCDADAGHEHGTRACQALLGSLEQFGPLEGFAGSNLLRLYRMRIHA